MKNQRIHFHSKATNHFCSYYTKKNARLKIVRFLCDSASLPFGKARISSI